MNIQILPGSSMRALGLILCNGMWRWEEASRLSVVLSHVSNTGDMGHPGQAVESAARNVNTAMCFPRSENTGRGALDAVSTDSGVGATCLLFAFAASPQIFNSESKIEGVHIHTPPHQMYCRLFYRIACCRIER
jgi:hypothetical protein